jgi:hypothetical protein
MSAETAFLIAFFAIVVAIVLLVLAALVFEADGDPPAPEQETAATPRAGRTGSAHVSGASQRRISV